MLHIAPQHILKAPYGSRAVITGIPLEVTDGELMEALSDYRLTFVKRLRKKTENGFRQSLSYLLCFQSKEAPELVYFGYLRLLTRPYNPPPQRCYKCNRFGHKNEQCRGQRCCSKCGSKEHEYKECPNDRNCVNCRGKHSAAYGGCAIYKQEAKIQIVKKRSNVSYSRVKKSYYLNQTTSR